MKRNNRHIIGITFVLFTAFPCFSQEKMLTVHAENKTLSQVLEDVASTYRIRFAFNADHFTRVRVDLLRLESVPLTRFLNDICQKYHLLYELIDGTYVLYPNPAPGEKPGSVLFEGLITDKSTGEPLYFCHLVLGQDKGMITNDMGIFSQKIENTDQLTVRISHLGYQHLDTVLNPAPGAFHKIGLTPFPVQIGTIRVYQQEKDVVEMTKGSEKIALNPRQSATLPRIDDSDLMTALSLIPGVYLLGGQAPGISIRGGSPAENLVLLDGIPVLETSHLFGNISVLNAKFISQAFISRGAFDATQGERVSGVVELSGQFNYTRPSLDLSVNLMNVNAAGEVPLGKVISLSGAYRKSYIDQWENYLYKQILEQQTNSDQGASVIPAVHFDDFNVKLAIKPADKQEITINAFNSNDRQEREFLFSNPRFFRNERADSRNTGFSGNWKYQSGKNWQHRFSAGYNEVIRNSYSGLGMEPNKQGKGGKEDLNTDNNDLEEFRLDWSTEFKTGNFTHQAGTGACFDQVNYHYLAESSSGNIRTDSVRYNTKVTVLHAFAQEKIRLTSDIQLRLGIRVNHENSTGKFYLQPRYGISWNVTNDLNLFYAGGTYNQFLSSVRKIDYSGSAGRIWYLPDSTGTGIMKACQQVMGVRYEKNGLSLNAEAYYKKTDNKLSLYGEVTGSTEKIVQYVPVEGESENYGFEVFFHFRQASFTHMLAWSLSKSNERFEDFAGGETYPSFDDQRHRIRWTEMARYKSWTVSTNLTCHSGSPYPVSGFSDSMPRFERLPWFVQADLSFMKRFRYKFFTLSSGISLLNLFNRANVLEVDYFNMSDETASYSFRTDIRAMRFTPVFFINLRLN